MLFAGYGFFEGMPVRNSDRHPFLQNAAGKRKLHTFVSRCVIMIATPHRVMLATYIGPSYLKKAGKVGMYTEQK